VARRICPRCGSRNTAQILWGMPAFTEELQEKLDKKEIVLRGCCITETDPSHQCNKCNKDFGGKYFQFPTGVKELYFYVGGFFGTSHWVYLNTETTGQVLKYANTEGPGINIKTEEFIEGAEIMRVPLNNQWIKFNDDLLRCYFIDWKPQYVDKDVIDGTQWELEVILEDGTKVKRYGSNAISTPLGQAT
jgi:hypothetical protein